MNKYYYDIADELFEDVLLTKYAKVSSLKLKNLTINETTFKTSKNPFNKSKGTYCSFCFKSLEDEKVFKITKKYLVKYLKDFVFHLTKKEKPKILFVGLGNEMYTPDALGPKVVKQINSNYFYKGKVGCLIPGVMALTGMETSDIIKGVLKCHDYELVIVIDSLATTSIERLNKVIQITDTGISPGSGVNNYRKPISYKELNTKVLTLGIATVISYQKIIEEFAVKNKIDIENKVVDNSLVLTSKEIENEIDYLTLLISSSFNELMS